MDPTVPAEDGQDDENEDNEPAQDQVTRLIADCLDMPDILRPIFKNFSSTELLKLSLVNHLWNSEARLVLKARGNIIATTLESNTCEDLEDFAIGLHFMQIMPFAGMRIKVGGQHKCSSQDLPAHELVAICDEILYRINWRILTVQFGRDWDKHQYCPGLLLLKQILHKSSTALQELSPNQSINNTFILKEFSLRVVTRQSAFLEDVIQDYKFPKLNTLKFQDFGPYTKSEEYTNLIKELVSRASTLQTLYTRGRVDLNANLREGSMALHETDYPFSPSLDEIPEDAVSLLRLERMTLVDIHRDLFAGRFNSITFGVVQKSRTTLTHIVMDAPFLVPFMMYEISLRNVRTLKIKFDYSREFAKSKQDVWHCLESFDFTRTFPNLDTVQIYGDWKCTERLQRVLNTLSGMVDEGRGKSALGDRAVNIKNLELEWNLVLSRDYVKTFAKMFPNIRSLSIRADGIVPFDDIIYASWVELEELDVSIMGVNICLNLNLDTDFCGIFPEELARLRQQDDKFLERVNIVPVMPSIVSLKNLKTLKICLEWESKFGLEPTELGCPNALFSKVTPLVAFKKIPNLTLTLLAYDERVQKVLTHLKPYLPDMLDFLT